MDYEFFHALTAEEAQEFLDRFRQLEHAALQAMLPNAASDGVALNYSISSMVPALKWMMRQTRVQRVPVPEDEPAWIREAHASGLIEFDESSKSMILRAAYYLGESFARLPGMRWTTGDVEYIEKNMPVVAGFQNDEELPPLVVVKNLFARILGNGKPESEIDATIAVWLRDVKLGKGSA
jgi:hypothetical protein